MKQPLDPTPYRQHRLSRKVSPDLGDGNYVYVQSEDDEIWVLPDGPNRHPRILGNATPVKYAGDLRVENGTIVDITNLSGTFLCDEPDGLIEAAEISRQSGLKLADSAVRFFFRPTVHDLAFFNDFQRCTTPCPLRCRLSFLRTTQNVVDSCVKL